MESATLTRPRPGPAWLARLRAVPASDWARAGFARCCASAALAGFFVYPTYPTYDSYYALIWGRDILHLHLPVSRCTARPTEHPLAIAFGAAAVDLRPGRRPADDPRRDRLLRRARRRRCTASGGSPSGRSSGVVAAGLLLTPLRLRVPRRAGLPRLPLHGAGRVGRGAGGRAAAPRGAGASCCSPPPGCCAPRPGCCRGLLAWCAWPRRLAPTRAWRYCSALARGRRPAAVGRRST